MNKNIETIKEINEIKSESKVFILLFSADWCPACRAFKPIYNKVAENKPELNMMHTDLDEAFQEFGIANLPTTLIFVDGKQEDKLVGIIEEDKLTEIVEGYSNK